MCEMQLRVQKGELLDKHLFDWIVRSTRASDQVISIRLGTDHADLTTEVLTCNGAKGDPGRHSADNVSLKLGGTRIICGRRWSRRRRIRWFEMRRAITA